MKNICLLLFTILLYSSCANQTSPTGGPKDETPPKLVLSTPSQGQRNYTDTKIILEFDELINLKNPQSQILITPRTSVKYDIKYKRNIVTMEFDSLLDQNTTYTISFRESIVDITENNPAQNLQIAFSTGPNLDTLQQTGRVTHAFTRERVPGATVILYNAEDTVDLFTGLPYYFTEANDSGYYELNNLKDGRYRIYALNDNNSDLKAQSDSEPYGFINDTISVGASNPPIDFNIVNLNLDSLKVFSSRRLGSTYNIKYSKTVTDFRLDKNEEVLAYLDKEDASVLRLQSTVEISAEDSTLVNLIVKDSVGNTLESEFYAQFDINSTRKQDYFLSLTGNPVFVNQPVVNYEFNFSKPTFILNPDSLYIEIDSLHQYRFDSTHLNWNFNRTTLSLSYLLDRSLFEKNDSARSTGPKQRATPELKWGTNSFVSIENDTLRPGSDPLSFLTPNLTATLILNVQNSPEDTVVLQMIDDSDNLFIEKIIDTDKSYTINKIPPGTYEIRFIYDSNGNRQWDPGNYYLRTQPEYIKYLEDEGGNRKWRLRENFTIDQTVSLTRE